MHRAPEVRKVLARFPRASVSLLPAYAPELNPVERIRRNGKARELRVYCGDAEEDAEDRVDRLAAPLVASASHPARSRVADRTESAGAHGVVDYCSAL